MATNPPAYTQPTYKAPKGALPAWASDPSKMTAQDLTTMAGPMKEATTWTPSKNALVSNQLNKLIASDNPYMQQARTKATQYANSRGLMNSSIAAGAGESAAIEAAAPIAQADAATYARSESENAGAKNTFGLDANRFGREGALARMNAGFEMGAQQRDHSFQAGESAAERAARESEFSRDLGSKESQFARDLGLRRDTLTADVKLRTGDQGIRRDELGLRRDEFKTDAQIRREELGLRGRELESDTKLKQATLNQEMQRQFMEARVALETSPNLKGAAKANAINALTNWFYENAVVDVKKSLARPEAWPTHVIKPAPTDHKDPPKGAAGGGGGGGAPAPGRSPYLPGSIQDVTWRNNMGFTGA